MKSQLEKFEDCSFVFAVLLELGPPLLTYLLPWVEAPLLLPAPLSVLRIVGGGAGVVSGAVVEDARGDRHQGE